MDSRNIHILLLSTIVFLFSSSVKAHPTGNMIAVGDHVLWSYINPINDIEHHACVMKWSEGRDPRVLITSEYSGSDFMLYNNQRDKDIYIIERRYIQTDDQFQIRILKTTLNGEPKVIWNWMDDNWRIGEHGFFMVSDDQIVFGSYPNIYNLHKGGKPTKYFDFQESIHRIRALPNNQILLLGKNSCWLARQDGDIIKQWNELLEKNVRNATLNRNQVFDVDYIDGKLLLAYWGKRCFDMIDVNGTRKTLVRQTEPLTPHWVAFQGNDKLLFSSNMVMNGKPPTPNLTKMTANGYSFRIW